MKQYFIIIKKGKISAFDGYSLVGERLCLWKELQQKYGVTELEAINILNGYSIPDYVEKYQRIKNLIPLNADKKKKMESDEYEKE